MNTTTVDLSPLVQIAASFLGVVLPAIAVYIAWVLKQRMNIQQRSADATAIDAAVQRAGGLAKDFISKVMPVNPTVEIRNAGIAQGLNHVMAALPDTRTRMGVTPETLTRMITSELAQLEPPTSAPVPPVTPPAPAPITTDTPSPPSNPPPVVLPVTP